MVKLKKIILILLLIPLTLYAALNVLSLGCFLFQYMLIKQIEIVRIDDTPCDKMIPVKYILQDDDPDLPKYCYMIARDNKKFLLKKSKSGKLKLTTSRYELYGFAVIGASYRITDSEIEKELSDYYDKNAVE